jgi:hypothetical protein
MSYYFFLVAIKYKPVKRVDRDTIKNILSRFVSCIELASKTVITTIKVVMSKDMK